MSNHVIINNILEELKIFPSSPRSIKIKKQRLNFFFLRRKLGKKRLSLFFKHFGCKTSIFEYMSKNKNMFLTISDKHFYFFMFLNRIAFLEKHRGLKAAAFSISKQITLNTVKGLRYQIGLPVRGQRTRSNRKNARFCKRKSYFIEPQFFSPRNIINIQLFRQKWRNGYEEKPQKLKNNRLTYISF